MRSMTPTNPRWRRAYKVIVDGHSSVARGRWRIRYREGKAARPRPPSRIFVCGTYYDALDYGPYQGEVWEGWALDLEPVEELADFPTEAAINLFWDPGRDPEMTPAVGPPPPGTLGCRAFIPTQWLYTV